MLLMLLGNAGIVTAVASLILGFANTGSMEQNALRLGLLIGGLLVLWGIATSRLVDRVMSRA